MADSRALVEKLWSYCNVLRDDGVSTIEYTEQLTYLLFLKMAHERQTRPLKPERIVPAECSWQRLLDADGDELEVTYRHGLEQLGRQPGTLGVIFRKAQNRIQDPAKLKRLVVDLIDKENWSAAGVDIKGDAYEELLSKGAEDIKSGAGQYRHQGRACEEVAVKADALNPRELFGTTVHYEIPAFQRPYVWTEEDQWAPLWQDVRRVAERIIEAGDDADALLAITGHFLGAVVLKSKPAIAGDVTRHSVIDGQQRTTTLQLLLDAVQEILKDRGHELEAEALEELILNGANRFAGKPERFKLWPSRSDRFAFEAAMAGNHATVDEHLIVQAHAFFRKEVADWLDGTVDGDAQPVGSEEERAHALADVMQSRLLLVAINLAGHDDDQLIFETLNDRGTPLLKADLIKNWIFQTGEQLGADVDAWPDKYWLDLDDTWWREEISQGRHLRSRIDIFLQYWLTMRTRAEVLTDEVFRAFIDHAKSRMTVPSEAEALLAELRRDADTFRSFAQLSPTTVEGRFYNRVVEALELASTTPLLLWLLSENHAVPAPQVEKALGALESWVIRRTLLRYTMKGVNLLMVSILTDLDASDVDKAGDRVAAFLAAQTADARAWPTDDEVRATLPGVRLYGNVRQPRIRVVLEALEEQLRTEKHEALGIPPGMQIEHVMPQGWRHYWDETPPLTPEAAANRDRLINTIGNLTLLTQKLNGALSNRPWTDADAAEVGATGQDAGLGKRSLINKYSLLVLSRELVDENPLAWTEDAIRARSARLSDLLCKVWPGPGQGREAEGG